LGLNVSQTGDAGLTLQSLSLRLFQQTAPDTFKVADTFSFNGPFTFSGATCSRGGSARLRSRNQERLAEFRGDRREAIFLFFLRHPREQTSPLWVLSAVLAIARARKAYCNSICSVFKHLATSASLPLAQLMSRYRKR
jgi:hypothetical protein